MLNKKTYFLIVFFVIKNYSSRFKEIYADDRK